MRGLNGDRLLKRFVGSILHQPRSNRPRVLGAGQDNAEETTAEPSDPKPEKVEGKRESENHEDTNTVTSVPDP